MNNVDKFPKLILSKSADINNSEKSLDFYLYSHCLLKIYR